MENDRKRHKADNGLHQKHSQRDFPILEIQIGAGVIFFIGLLFGSGNINETTTFTTICTILTTSLMFLEGILIILQKKAPRPGLTSITGIGAIFTGIMGALIFGSSTSILLSSLIVEILK